MQESFGIEKFYDKVYLNGELILKRQNTNIYGIAGGNRDFYCNSPLQLALALVQVIDDMDNEIKQLRERINGHN